MDFNEKLQKLRNQRGLTQEEVAEAIFVSRTAISKWESGRGYPNIDSLKALAKFFSVTIDELLSSDEILTIAEETTKEKEKHFCDIAFGLIDCSLLMILFLPFFRQSVDGVLQSVSLLNLDIIESYLKCIYFISIIAVVLFGLIILALQNYNGIFWQKNKYKISLILNIVATLIFIISMQPYAASFLFTFLIIRVLILLRG